MIRRASTVAEATRAGPVEESGRIANLDALRGVAAFDILPMNAAPTGWNRVPVSTSAPLSMIPNTIGASPATLGFSALNILWNTRSETWLHRRVRAVGRVALSNCLTQTIIGILILRVALEDIELNRAVVLGFIVVVWALQLWWLAAWLSRFCCRPFEWVWRVLTCRRKQALRR